MVNRFCAEHESYCGAADELLGVLERQSSGRILRIEFGATNDSMSNRSAVNDPNN
jgi:hypothetical protein